MLTEELRERINKLSHVKRQLLNQQLRDRRAANIAPSAILPVAAKSTAESIAESVAAAAAAFPLSHTQQMIWRTQAAYPTATFYNFPQVLRLDGALDTTALASALRYLVARHDVLRTRLVLAGGEPYALVAPATDTDTDTDTDSADASELRGHELPRAIASSPILDDLLYQHVQRPFNLAEDLPLSAWLVQLAPARHVLALVHHFAAFDYWSLALFNRELGHCYDAFAAGRPPSLPSLPFAYADYAAWQRSPANEDRLAGSSYYWRWQLAKRTRATAGPDDRFRPAVTQFAADSFEFCLPSAMLGRLETLAQHENATLFMLLLASLQTLLARFTERNEIAVGTIVANRPSLETESLLGNFSNRLLLWGNLSGNPSFRQLLRRVRGATLDAYTRQDVPLDRMAVDLYGAGFHPSYLFPVMFDYISEPLAPPNLNGLTVTRLPIQCSEIEYPLHVTAQRSPDHLRVRLQVRPDFEVRTTVPHMAYHWNTLLSAIADDPDQRIDSLPLTKHQPSRIIAEGWLATANPLSNSQAARL